MNMTMNRQAQTGIGLVEVLVALALLGIAMLGFSVMQIKAVKATDESLLRSRALTLMRGGAEMMRANPSPDAIKAFQDTLFAPAKATVADYDIEVQKCLGKSPTPCTPVQMATRDANAIKQQALENDMKISMVGCPATNDTLKCMIASWGKTEPRLGTAHNDCAKPNGSYNPDASCFIMEAY